MCHTRPPQTLVVSVIDNGIGLQSKSQEELFTEFNSNAEAAAAAIGGSSEAAVSCLTPLCLCVPVGASMA